MTVMTGEAEKGRGIKLLPFSVSNVHEGIRTSDLPLRSTIGGRSSSSNDV